MLCVDMCVDVCVDMCADVCVEMCGQDRAVRDDVDPGEWEWNGWGRQLDGSAPISGCQNGRASSIFYSMAFLFYIAMGGLSF